jgi:hypothetical protein
VPPPNSGVADTLGEAKVALMKRYEKVRRRNSLNEQKITERLVGGARITSSTPPPGLRLREPKDSVSILRPPPNLQPC